MISGSKLILAAILFLAKYIAITVIHKSIGINKITMMKNKNIANCEFDTESTPDASLAILLNPKTMQITKV